MKYGPMTNKVAARAGQPSCAALRIQALRLAVSLPTIQTR